MTWTSQSPYLHHRFHVLFSSAWFLDCIFLRCMIGRQFHPIIYSILAHFAYKYVVNIAPD